MISKLAMKNYWLVKQEPEAYSWTDFVREGGTKWTGVRNFQARNNLRDAQRRRRFVLPQRERTKLSSASRRSHAKRSDPTAKEGDWSAVELEP